MRKFLFKNITLIDEGYEAREGMDIVVDDDRIASIAPAADRQASGGPGGFDGEVYDGRGKVAMPGFFNIHCHVPMTLIRGYGEGLPLHEWLFGRMIPFEELLDDEDCYWGSLLGIAEMLASGTVSFSDMYMHTPGIARAVLESGIKANLSHGYSSRSKGEHFSDSKAFAGTKFLIGAARGDGSGRLKADAAVHAEYTLGEERLVAEIADFCEAEALRVQVHLSETRRDHEECVDRRGATPARFFDSFGLFRAPTTAAHCVWLEDGDFEILAERGVTVAHCPSSNMKLGSGIAPVAKMLEKGIRVGIGTDGAASNNNLNALEEANLAAMIQKGATGDPLILGPRQLLELACRNGAIAQGREDCGAIAVGDRADIVVYDLESAHLQPVYDVLSNLLFSARASDIVLTMVDGRVLYKDGEYTTIDIGRVISEANRIRVEKLARLERKQWKKSHP